MLWETVQNSRVSEDRLLLPATNSQFVKDNRVLGTTECRDDIELWRGECGTHVSFSHIIVTSFFYFDDVIIWFTHLLLIMV